MVKLYVEKPQNYEIIGIVSASSDSSQNEQEKMDYAIEELKKQAAKIGANGVIIENIGQDSQTVPMTTGGITYYIPVTEKTVSGKAIFVNK